jgi:hypothetical protein
MSDQKSDDDQRRDKLLLRLLKMPPQSRAQLAEAVRRAKEENPNRSHGKRAISQKPASRERVPAGRTQRRKSPST